MISYKHSFAIVRAKGMDDKVLFTYKTREQANKALIKLGGDPGPVSQCGDRSLRIVSLCDYEIIEVFDQHTIRLR